MIKKDYYTLKEIILGLSNEYQVHQQELQKLKELCTMDEKRASDFHFSVYQSEHKRPKLLCTYEPKQNLFKKLATDFSIKVGYYIYGGNTVRLVTDNNEYYFLCGYKKYPIRIKHDYGREEEFYHQATSILNSEFSNNIRSKYIEENKSGIAATLTIDAIEIELHIRNKGGNLPESLVWYDSAKETMKFKSYEGILNNQYINTVLNINFPTSELNPYHIQKICSSEKTEKPIVLQYDGAKDMIELDIIEEEKQVVLCKKR